MAEPSIYVLTGATSGMGLLLAERLLAATDSEIVIGARTPDKIQHLLRSGGGRVKTAPLDLSRLSSVRAFVNEMRRDLGAERKLAAIVCNAGAQSIEAPRMTEDGVEETFAANHLGHFLLVHSLLDALEPGALVISTASGTHNPNDPLARRFGFRGPVRLDPAAFAKGDLDGSVGAAQQGMDRYAASKLCNILFTREMARRTPAERAKFLAFDPGLMPGTGLARERSAIEQFAWRNIMPLARFAMRGVSTPEQSSARLFELVASRGAGWSTGDHLEFRGRPAPESDAASDPALAAQLHELSLRLAGLT